MSCSLIDNCNLLAHFLKNHRYCQKQFNGVPIVIRSPVKVLAALGLANAEDNVTLEMLLTLMGDRFIGIVDDDFSALRALNPTLELKVGDLFWNIDKANPKYLWDEFYLYYEPAGIALFGQVPSLQALYADKKIICLAPAENKKWYWNKYFMYGRGQGGLYLVNPIAHSQVFEQYQPLSVRLVVGVILRLLETENLLLRDEKIYQTKSRVAGYSLVAGIQSLNAIYRVIIKQGLTLPNKSCSDCEPCSGFMLGRKIF